MRKILGFIFFFCLVGLELAAQNVDLLQSRYNEAVKSRDYVSAMSMAAELARHHDRRRDQASAESMYEEAVRWALMQPDGRRRAQAFEEAGRFYKRSQKREQAARYLNQAFSWYKAGQDASGQARVSLELGSLYFAAGNLNRAEQQWLQAMEIAEENNLSARLMDSYARLAELYDKKNDKAKAQFFHKQYQVLLNPNRASDEEKKQETAIRRLRDQLGDSLRLQDSVKRTLLAELNTREQQKLEFARRLAQAKDSLEQIGDELSASKLLIEEQQKTTRAYIIASVTMALLLVVAGLLYFRIREQKKALARSHDEIVTQQKQIIAQSTALEKEKAKADNLLLNILPEEVAIELKEKNYAAPRYYPMVSVLFCDFKGFTTIAARTSPEQIVVELNDCFSGFDDICDRFNVEKIKTIGDAYMCAAGIPVPSNSHAIDAVNAALEMARFMDRRNQEKRARGEFALEYRIGIHSGPVVAGVVGKKKFAYDIWGDTVNLASRMESSGEAGKINVSEATYELVKSEFFCRYRGQIEAKNKGMVDMFFVEERL